MSLIDILLLSAVLATASALLFPVGLWPTRLALLVLLVLAALQLALEGYVWQFTPAYPVVLIVGVLAWRRPASTGRWARRLSRVGLLALMLVALGPWIMLPVPRLPGPTGPYAVGTQVFRWTDTSRPEPATPDPADRRSVIAQAWYPRAGHAPGPHSAYIDGLGRLPPYVSFLPRFMLRAYGRVDTHAVPAARLSPDRRQWPVVVFSPGYGASRAFYTSLVADLASRGYVVLALDHPYESAITELADGRIATPREALLPNDPDRHRYMERQQEVRAADVAFVVDQLARPTAMGPRLAGRLDLNHVGAIGHSFGGATSAVAAARDPRIKAAANIDGTLYGTAADQRLAQPFLLLESDHGETGHSAIFLEGNGRLLDGLQAGGYRYEIARANHYSFTDAPLLLSGPGRFLLSRVIGGSRGPRETQRATVDILTAFLSAPLTGRPLSVEAAAARYPDIAGGPVAPAGPTTRASGG